MYSHVLEKWTKVQHIHVRETIVYVVLIVYINSTFTTQNQSLLTLACGVCVRVCACVHVCEICDTQPAAIYMHVYVTLHDTQL